MLRIGLLLPAVLVAFAVDLAAQEISVRPNTQIPVELRTTLKSDSSKVGTKVEFHTTEAVLIGHNVVVPNGAKVMGRIERIAIAASRSPRSLLSISINSLQWKNGEAPLNAVIIAVEPTPAESMAMIPRRHLFRTPPTFLKDIHIRSHLLRNAVTDFYSDQPNFTVHSGLYFLLREIDPDHGSPMMGNDNILDIGPRPEPDE